MGVKKQVKRFAPTIEQLLVVHDTAYPKIIESGSGCGKTSVLRFFAEEFPDAKILYLTYSKKMKEESRQSFAKNVTVHSISSLVYAISGKPLRNKIVDNLDINLILDNYPGLSITEASIVVSALNDYFNSDIEKFVFHPNRKLEKISIECFERMADPADSMKISFDALTKLFSLLNKVLDYDFIIVDEAQDINRVAENILKKQVSAKFIYVGDDLQNIFGYRDTVSLLTSPTHKLTETFRFSQELCDLANKFIKAKLDIEKNMTSNKKDKTIISNYMDFDLSVQETQVTYISRTNAHLIEYAIYLLMNKQTFFFEGGTETLEFIQDGLYLKSGEKGRIRNKFLSRFSSITHLEKVAEEIDDISINFLLRVLSIEYIEALFDDIKNGVVLRDRADVILTTVHKCKGLEFDTVVLGSDFTPFYDKDTGEELSLEREEVNIIYTAMTRAKENLFLNRDLTKWIEN